jgi:hypothetical protein
MSEALKLCTALVLVAIEVRHSHQPGPPQADARCARPLQEKGLVAVKQRLWQDVVLRPDDLMRLLVPAVLYTVQNNLQYVAVSNLDAASYQVRHTHKHLHTLTIITHPLQALARPTIPSQQELTPPFWLTR